jgi:hypothetical protein
VEIKTDENKNIHMSILGTSSNDGMEIEVVTMYLYRNRKTDDLNIEIRDLSI